MSVPTFNAEEARAEAFGGRSLNEFKHKHLWTRPTDSADAHKYPVDLVNQEGIGNAHAIDRHVAKTDEQLAQRMRDKYPPGATTYTDLESAQYYTQLAIDRDPEDKVTELLDGGGSPAEVSFSVDLGPDVTGHGISRSNYHGIDNWTVTENHSVALTLRYAAGLNPPFIVVTSYPE